MIKLTRTKLTLKKRTDTLRTLIRQDAAVHKLEKAAAKSARCENSSPSRKNR